MFNGKKAVHPVIAVTLLVSLGVLAVVGFQNWYSNYQAGLQNKVENQETENIQTKIDRVVGSNLYFRNGFDENITVTDVKVNGTSCLINGSYNSGLQTLDLSSCNVNLSGNVEIVVFTNKGIFSKKEYFKNSVNLESSLDCSSLNGGEWVEVLGSGTFSTSDFCVMKYEAKEDSSGACPDGDTVNCPISQASSSPWVSINQTNAQIECESLGEGYHLITNAEWMTIARNIEQVQSNWADNTIGSTVSSGGGLKRGNVGITDSVSYDGSNPESGTGRNTKALLNLSNGEGIWDLSGNVWEWTNDTCSQANWDTGANIEWTVSSPDLSDYEILNAGPLGNYNSSHGVGRYYGCSSEGNRFIRGGLNTLGATSGVFSINLNIGASTSSTAFGFRCAYTP